MTPRELLAIRFADPVKRRDLLTVVNMIETEIENRVAEAVADYEEVLTEHRKLVRQLDVALNGEAGAAKQASLCDIVGQAEDIRRHYEHTSALSPAREGEKT